MGQNRKIEEAQAKEEELVVKNEELVWQWMEEIQEQVWLQLNGK